MKEIIYIFARDFNQWTNQLVKEAYASSIKFLWGEGLNDQMIHYTGRTFIWYRYKDENENLKNYMVKKSLESDIFKEKLHLQFKEDVKKLRELISVEKVIDDEIHLMKIKQLFKRMYPLYPLSIFIAGPWREEFLKNHLKCGEKVVNLLMESRHLSEGLLKENDNFMRKWLGPKLKESGLLYSDLKLLSVEEIDELVINKDIKNKNSIIKRRNGFFYMNDQIHLISNFYDFIKNNHIFLEEDIIKKSLNGKTVFGSGLLRGKVRIVMNSDEVQNFKDDEILLTTMTAPDYLPIIYKSKAIITDEGSLTCHVAIVAREIKKPAIMGCKGATSTFKDGDLVEIDLDNGVVRKL